MEATSTLALELALAVLNEPHQRLPYARQLLPVSATEDTDDGSSGYCGSISSTSTTLSDSERANPLHWPSWMTPTKDNDNCCSLLDYIWTFASLVTGNSTDVKVKLNNPITKLDSISSSFSESQSQTARTIVNVDLEFIGPNDGPHHSLDRETTTPTDPRKMFIRKPDGIAVNSITGEIYIPDRQHNVVLILGPDGSFQSQLGEPGCGPGQFRRPTAVAFDSEGDQLYITDKDNHRIQVFNAASGHFLFTFGSPGQNNGQLNYPSGIAILNKEGCSLVAVADSHNARVQFFTKDGLCLDYFDAFTTGREHISSTGRAYPVKHQPRGVVFDPTGDLLYISDFNHNCIFKLDLVRRTLGKFLINRYSRSLYRPCGIDVDSQGNLFICDQRNHSLRMFRKDGSEVEGFLGGISFKLPTDVSLYPGLPGFLAVIDFNGRVRVLNYSN